MIRVEKYDWGFQGYDGWHSHQANSAGGVSVKYTVKNYGTKPVKKYTIWFKPYNGADEAVSCTKSEICVNGVSSADRVETNACQEGFFKNAWWNHSIRRVEIDHIDVVYDDYTTEFMQEWEKEWERRMQEETKKYLEQRMQEEAERKKEEAIRRKEELERERKKAEMEKEKAKKQMIKDWIFNILLYLLLAGVISLIIELLS